MTTNVRKDELWEIKKRVIQTQYAALCEYIEPRRHYSYLRSKMLLSSDDHERIDSALTRKDRAIKLIDILLTKGPAAFDGLCDSIKDERTQIFLLEILNRALQNEIDKSHNPQVASSPNDLYSTEWSGKLPNPGDIRASTNSTRSNH